MYLDMTSDLVLPVRLEVAHVAGIFRELQMLRFDMEVQVIVALGRSNHFSETNFKMTEKFLLLKPFRSPGRCADPWDPCRWACGLS